MAFTPVTAFSAGHLRLGTMYRSSEAGTDGATSKSSTMNLELGAGWSSPSGWIIGGLYAQETQSSDGADALARSGTGVTAGWASQQESGFYALFTYFLSLSRGPEKGEGIQGDFGYRFQIRKISFAPQLSYRDLKFGDTAPKEVSKTIDPLFVFWIGF